jgi:hypothetical protein
MIDSLLQQTDFDPSGKQIKATDVAFKGKLIAPLSSA